MATIDNYIKLLIDQKARSLVLQTGTGVQILDGEGTTQEGSDVLDTEHILSMLEEVLPTDFNKDVEVASKVFHYESPFGKVKVTVNIKQNNASVRIEQEIDGEDREDVEESTLQNEACQSEEEYKSKIDRMFNRMLDLNASDLHLKSGHIPMVRVYGAMQLLDGWPRFEGDEVKNLISTIIPNENLKQFEATKDTDFAYMLKGRGRFRCNVFEDIAGIGGVFRHIPSKIRTVNELHIPPAIMELCDLTEGLILVTGPTNSGKTTTLAAMLNYINEKRSGHIITIEDPVEYLHKDNNCLINQRQVGTNTADFKSALRAALREDPDIILIGELRDLETMEMALKTAETGHLVFATLHTNTAATTIDRVIDQFPAGRQNQIRIMLAESLVGVLSQTLCNRREGGLVAAFEVLIVTNAVSNMIREEKTYQLPSTIQSSRNLGMQSMNNHLIDLVKKKIIKPEEAYLRSISKKEIASTLTVEGFRGKWSEVHH